MINVKRTAVEPDKLINNDIAGYREKAKGMTINLMKPDFTIIPLKYFISTLGLNGKFFSLDICEVLSNS